MLDIYCIVFYYLNRILLNFAFEEQDKREKYEDGNVKDAQRGTLLLRRAGVAREF